MRELKGLFEGIDCSVEGAGLPPSVDGIAYDSRAVNPGDVFFCLRGSRRDGHEFAAAALAAGAAVAVVDGDAALGPDQPVIRVPDARRAMAAVSARYYGFPSREMQVIGVTGTNGKTSTTYFTSSIFEKAGYPSGVIGTLGHRLGDVWHSASMTTPESPDLQRYLRHMADAKVRCVAMEVSSHALELHRVRGTEFRTVVFTNLGHDHLDFHGTLERYREVKESLFLSSRDGEDPMSFGRGRIAVINSDDPTGRGILAKTTLPTVTYGIEREADVRAESIRLEPGATFLKIRFPEGTVPVRLAIPGRVNVYNALAASAAAAASLVPPEKIAEGLEALTHVPGRLESVRCGQPFEVLVDYAHNPPALECLLSGVREMTRGRVILVFGCGGDRDRAKRPEMARIAQRLADFVVATSDNPRTEDPATILEDIQRGFDPQARYVMIPDRAEAIQRGIDEARKGDVVIIAGKGHEDYQIIGRTKIHFDDRDVAREILDQW
ncbi:MAG: UDP-N-acetylmuramoyl-L-alanyl-D-glutamate--2,6-diaminopimelate ligase [Candidatus Eisenbacteria sp.]|nr:UDP-N-acetylmuramoyl-L-alanyl-D-glutamate--2,6-diaminopimelate ligase [Candidatus Eisenbacteria bacterium]